MGKLTISGRTRLGARAGLAALAMAATASHADESERGPEKAPVIKLAEAVGHVTVNRAADAQGRHVYAVRQNFSGSDRMVAFSTRRLAAVRPAGMAGLSPVALPRGLPLASTRLTSGFGYRRHPMLGTIRAHNGLDLAAPAGTPVFATSDGTVDSAGWRGRYGLLIQLDHGDALETRYGHLAQVNVVAGQRVRKGEIIGFVGSTGMSTGPHLHYEVRVNQLPVNPLRGR